MVTIIFGLVTKNLRPIDGSVTSLPSTSNIFIFRPFPFNKEKTFSANEFNSTITVSLLSYLSK